MSRHKNNNTEIDELIERKRKKDAIEEQKNIINTLLDEIKQKDRLIQAYEKTKIINEYPKIIEKKYKHKDEATVLALLSDTHCEHHITKQSTNGINEYNLDICKDRLEKFAINLVKLTEKKREMIVLDNLVLAILGDIIHGFIHEEYQISNLLTPIEATMFAIGQLSRVLDYILLHGKFNRIVVICKVGNHSRTTKKIYADNLGKVSYEWVVYQSLKNKYQQIEWLIEESYFTYYQIYNLVGRFHHGHAISYQGGIGGVYVPLVRFVTRLNKQKYADFDAIGHFHQMDFLRNAGIIVNGSLCGVDAYTISKGFSPEPPRQVFQIVDARRGLTTNEPIILT